MQLKKILIAIKDEAVIFTAKLNEKDWTIEEIPFNKTQPESVIYCILPNGNNCCIGTKKGLFFITNNSFQQVSNAMQPTAVSEIICLNLNAKNKQLKKIFFICMLCIKFLFFQITKCGNWNNRPSFSKIFSNTIGDKLSYYGNTSFHSGLGIYSGLLQIHSDASCANIVFELIIFIC